MTRIVVKIGTQSLLAGDNGLDMGLIASLCAQIHRLRQEGVQIVLVSSGAVGAGRGLWRDIANGARIRDVVLEKQVLSSIGQTQLIQRYNEALAQYDMVAAQLLVTRYDFRNRWHCVNLGRLLETLLSDPHILPVMNENDSLAVEELVFSDNDELAGLISPQIGADRLILLTDVDGVYDAEKRTIHRIDAARAATIDTGLISGGGRGGMASKLATARRMARAGITTHIARAREPDILPRLLRDEAIGTRFIADRKPKPVKRWLAAGLADTRGRVIVNAALAHRLGQDAVATSLLPVGIVAIDGLFVRGDVVAITDEAGQYLGHGIARYDSANLANYLGKQKMPLFIHANEMHRE